MKNINGSNLCENLADAMQVIARLKDPNTKEITFDSETTGLDARNDLIIGYVFGFSGELQDHYYVPVRHSLSNEGNITDLYSKGMNPFEKELNSVLSTRRDLHLIMHNAPFDLRFLHSHNINVVGTLEDTMSNQALINEFTPSFSLENCCKEHGTIAKKGDGLYQYLATKFGGNADKKQMANYYKLSGNDEIGVDYAIGDSISTWHLRAAQVIEIKSQNLEQIYMIERGMTRVIFRMKKNGVKIDMRRLEEVQSIVADKVKEAKSKLPKDFNSRANSQVKDLMTRGGFLDWPLTAPTSRFPQGQASFNSEWLSGNKLGQDILNVRKWENLENLFLRPLVERHIHEGRIYPDYHQMATDDYGTVSGRLSCSNPNLQQISKRDVEKAKLIRSLFIPEEGHEWADADLNQCEPRILAHYSGCKVLVDGYLADPVVDAHDSTMRAIESAGIHIEGNYKEKRFKGKTINMGLIAGMGKAKMLAMLGEGGEEVYDAYFKVLPEIKKFQKQASDRFQQRGYVISLLGRRHRLLSYDKAFVATNRLLQGANANVTKNAMVKIDKLFEDDGDHCRIIGTVHDSIAFSFPPNKKSLIMEALRIFTDYGPGRTTELRVPLTANYAFGANWAEASFSESEGVI